MAAIIMGTERGAQKLCTKKEGLLNDIISKSRELWS
jgi:hypothetical protein